MSKKNKKRQSENPESANQEQPKKDNSPYVHQREKINFDLKIRKIDFTEKQQQFIDLVQDKSTKIVLCKGPAGTAKTFNSVFCALQAMQEKRVGEIIYIRTPCESSSYSIGFLKGESSEKLQPYAQPLEDKLSEFLPANQIKALKEEDRIKTVPTGFLRGLSKNAAYLIADEAQNLTVHDLLLIMTRIGKFSKLILIGDIKQSDIKNSGFDTIYNLFDNEESKIKGIKTFKFGKEDILRNDFLSFVIEKFEELDSKKDWMPSKK